MLNCSLSNFDFIFWFPFDAVSMTDFQIVETALPLASTLAETANDSEAHDLIPYTGRLLTCQFLFQYVADVDGPEGEVVFLLHIVPSGT